MHHFRGLSRTVVRSVRGAVLTAVGVTVLLAFPVVASAAPKQVVDEIGSPEFGETGGLFNAPRGVAVNQTGAGGVPAGTFYVVDSGNRRVQRFGPTGDFVSTWGWGVDEGNSEFELCTVAADCQKGLAGSGAGQLGNGGGQGIAVDQSNGNIYVSDQSSASRRVHVFGPKGSFHGAFGFGAIKTSEAKFQFCTTATGCTSANIAPGAQGGRFGTAIGGLAVDGLGNVYVANKTNRRVDVFKPTLDGTTVVGMEFVRAFGFDVQTGGVTTFEVCTIAASCKQGSGGSGVGQFAATNSPADVAVDSEGNIFALDAGNKRVEKFNSTPAPITATFGSAELTAVFGAGAVLFNIAVDPSATPNNLLVSGAQLDNEQRVAVAELDPTGANAIGPGLAHGEDLPITTANGLAVAQASVGGNIYVPTETVAVLRGVFVLGEVPTIEPVTEFTGTTATFKGSVVSNNIAVGYHFEYSTDGKSWIEVPAEDVQLAGAPGTIPVEVEATDLTGSQTYRVRLVQNRPLGGGQATSAETTFTTLAVKPAIQGTVASPIKDTSATFNAYLNPQNQATSYRFELGTESCAANPCTALPLLEAKGGGLRLVTQTATGLQPSTQYHYRLVATNASGSEVGPERTFETFAPGRSLPDDRAYELVTPPDTGAVVLGGFAWGEGEGNSCFEVLPTTADGNSVVSMSRGGSLPGLSVNGLFDLYESIRGPDGWTTIAKSATGSQTNLGQAGLCSSPDHLYSTMVTGPGPRDQGSLVVEDKQSSYVRGPDGTFSLVGQGSLGTDPEANARWISTGADHIIFTSKMQLEPDASSTVGPGEGESVFNPPVAAIYDRSPGGPTKVVSLLPSNLAPDPATETTIYQGASTDGSTVAFKVEKEFGSETTLYVRRNGVTTPVATGATPHALAFAGLSRSGDKLFYVDGEGTAPAGLFSFDVSSGVGTEIAPSSLFVNVSEDGSQAYFVSETVLTGSDENEHGQSAELGATNLYAWDAADGTQFVAVVDPADAALGERASLVNWTSDAVFPAPSTQHGRANSTSRTTPDGSVLLFESRADITGFDSNGHRQIYRYDIDGGALDCVSCPPTGVPPRADAALQRLVEQEGGKDPTDQFVPTSSLVRIQNLTDDGQTVFFETKDALVPTDVNGTWDVYEWKVGQQAYLISTGKGRLPSFLYGMTASGSDVFFTSTERLVAQDLSTVSSIYDARKGGGFPVSDPQPPCDSDECQGRVAGPPALPNAGSAGFQGPGNATPRRPRPCPKGKRRIKRKGKVLCVKRHRKARNGDRAGNQRGGRR